MDATPNWIDRLWANRNDLEAEEHLRQLWLGFQADRKQAWDQLRLLVAGSAKLRAAAETQIGLALPAIPQDELERLVSDALEEVEKTLKDERWHLPASTRGVFLPYLGKKNELGRHHWVQRVLSRHFENEALPGEREQQLLEGEES